MYPVSIETSGTTLLTHLCQEKDQMYETYLSTEWNRRLMTFLGDLKQPTCSACVEAGSDCSYSRARKRPGPAKGTRRRTKHSTTTGASSDGSSLEQEADTWWLSAGTDIPTMNQSVSTCGSGAAHQPAELSIDHPDPIMQPTPAALSSSGEYPYISFPQLAPEQESELYASRRATKAAASYLTVI